MSNFFPFYVQCSGTFYLFSEGSDNEGEKVYFFINAILVQSGYLEMPTYSELLMFRSGSLKMMLYSLCSGIFRNI